MRIKPLGTLSLSFMLLLVCCSATAQVVLHFDNRVGTQSLTNSQGAHKTTANEPFTVTLLQYYISNIELTKANGDKYIIPKKESCFLVKQHLDSSKSLAINLPEGLYTTISFLVGVDSLTSTLPIEERTGVLDPGRDMAASESMYWTWNSGYIFFKLEGSSPAIPADKTGFREFEYHIGGYGGYNTPTLNNIRRISLPLPSNAPLRVRNHQKAVVHIRFNVQQLLDRIDLKKHHHIMLTPESARIADNYAAAFSYGGTDYPNK
ncbi:hypothetical protein D3H65_01070 [Paraflavitalea soli]|uniref:Copper-binding protein MbnP-like domain-containing protein n=1 Tax=Paraflavitalea soli TaxID=2315862 RepID=A0A3B7ME84_9BACT|nr:MbnP family protein [Paraflavitalea soli]AXY72648.1 hypothetical protein D3H65_01070 [Paraflavitalea soli]